MDLDAARDFLRNNHRAVITSRRANGDPQLSPVMCGIDAAGRIVVSTRETALKVKNLRRDPRASLCVLNDGFFGDWIQVDGTAEIVSLPEAMELLIDYYRSLAGEHPDWDDYRAAMERERRVLVRIDIERAGPDRSG
ncbi:MAG TPA: PPOX class F420-dependent oxidoreductase [Acidimicrobiia bacterium]|nr:PPOX class F420-dependent oxidoreductase [Acidimicrobiia bacterium]